MIVQKEHQSITRFLSSKQCIYNLSPIDYPNQTEQMSILGYLFIKFTFDTLKDPLKSLQQICFKNNKNLQKVILGLLYRTFLHPNQQQLMFGFVKQLGSNAIDIYCQFYMKLVITQTDRFHDEALMVVPLIYHQLVRYNLFVQKVSITILRTINYIDFSERGLTYSYTIIEVLSDVIGIIDNKVKQKGEQSNGSIGRLIFIKVLRVLTSIFLFQQQQQIKIFIEKCKNLLLVLWRNNKKQCLYCGSEAFRFLQDFLSHPELNNLFQQYKTQYYANEKHLLYLPKNKYDELLAINIPIEVFDSIGFCMNNNPNQIYYQMNWFQKSNRENKNFQMVLIDILRYMIKIVEHDNRFVFIQWILMYSDKNKEISIMFKHLCLQTIFYDWFFNENLEDNEIIKRTETGFCILKFHQTNPTKFQQMLQFILFQQVKEVNNGLARVRDNLQKIFKLADQRGMFKIYNILNSNIIDGVVKQELKAFIFGKDIMQTIQNKKQEYSTVLMNRVQSYQSDDLWKQQSHDVFFDSPKIQRMKVQQQNHIQNSLGISIQKHFYEQNKQKILQLLQMPTKAHYQAYIDHLTTVCKRIYKDKQIYQKFVRQAIKIGYIIFQSHWESFYETKQIPPQENIIQIHINGLLKSWGTSDIGLDMHRKIIKGIIKQFPIGLFAIYFIFLMIVPTTKLHCQQINTFLTTGDNKKNIEKVLGKLFVDEDLQKTMKMKAYKYKILIQ